MNNSLGITAAMPTAPARVLQLGCSGTVSTALFVGHAAIPCADADLTEERVRPGLCCECMCRRLSLMQHLTAVLHGSTHAEDRVHIAAHLQIVELSNS